MTKGIIWSLFLEGREICKIINIMCILNYLISFSGVDIRRSELLGLLEYFFSF
jgi:hypothetical protein